MGGNIHNIKITTWGLHAYNASVASWLQSEITQNQAVWGCYLAGQAAL
jgi:hypothetical protein